MSREDILDLAVKAWHKQTQRSRKHLAICAEWGLFPAEIRAIRCKFNDLADLMADHGEHVSFVALWGSL